MNANVVSDNSQLRLLGTSKQLQRNTNPIKITDNRFKDDRYVSSNRRRFENTACYASVSLFHEDIYVLVYTNILHERLLNLLASALKVRS